MSHVFLIRHGQTDANLHPQNYPWDTDCSINETGRTQATGTAQYIASLPPSERPRRIISSPMLRTRQTAELIADKLGLPVYIDERLMESNVGSWHTRDIETVYSYFQSLPPSERFTFTSPGGESWQQVGERVATVAREHMQKITLIVSHYAPLECGVGVLLETPYDEWPNYIFPNASVTLLASKEARWQASYIGKTPYDENLKSSYPARRV